MSLLTHISNSSRFPPCPQQQERKMLAAKIRRVAGTAITKTTTAAAASALTRKPRLVYFHGTTAVAHGSGKDLNDAPRITLHWIGKKGEEFSTDGIVGESILDAAHRHEVELEGACEGVCACSTCHVILEDPVFEKLEDPSEEEEDMLDQAFGLTPTSRLGCQVELTQVLDGIRIKLPTATRNFYIDGHVPKPH